MQQSKTKEFLKIAFPAVIEALCLVIINTIDTKMISPLGEKAISAVSLTSQPMLLFFSIMYALGTTISILVAQANGKKDKKEASCYTALIIKITLITSIVLGVLLAVFAGPIMNICSQQKETVDMSIVFFRITAGFMVFNAVSTVVNSALRGIGKTTVTLVTCVISGVVDIFVNYLLIEGHLGFPALGVLGDAIGTVSGALASFIVSIVILMTRTELFKIKDLITIRFSQCKVFLHEIRIKFVSIEVENLALRLGFLFSSIIVSCLSVTESAVYSIALILLNYSFAFGNGIQNSLIALVGRSYGEKNINNIKSYTKIANISGLICSVALSLIYIIFAGRIYGGFFTDQLAVDMGIISTYIVAGETIIQIWRIICIGSLRGMGEVKAPRNIAIISVLIVNPIVGFICVKFFSMGIWGVWMASASSQLIWFVLGLISYTKFMRKINMDKKFQK